MEAASCKISVRTISEETRRKLSDAKLGSKHPAFGKTPSMETRAKMSATMTSIVRYDFDGVTPLPRHMKRVDHSSTSGYGITGHPALRVGSKHKRVEFSSMKFLVQQNRDLLPNLRTMCLSYLAHLDECEIRGVIPTPKSQFVKGPVSCVKTAGDA